MGANDPARSDSRLRVATGGAESSPHPAHTTESANGVPANSVPTNSVSDKKADILREKALSAPSTRSLRAAAENPVAADSADSSDDEVVDVTAVAMTYLEEDCRLLRAQK